MTDYSKMSDFDINKAVAELHGYDTKPIQFFALQGLSKVRTTERFFDYCKSWADAGPIIEKEKISLIFGFSHWDAMSEAGESLQAEEVNPLRAAMIVFLMMKEQADESES